MVRSLWIHEDDQYMRCLWPASALPYLVEDVQAAADAGARSLAPGGMGYTDVYVAKPPSARFWQCALKRDAVIARLAETLPRFDRVEDGYGGYALHAEKGPACFGFGNGCYIFAAMRDDLVDSFFFDARTDDVRTLGVLRKAIEAINALCSASLVDYWVKMSGAVSDNAFMDAYFSALTAGSQGEG